MLDAGADINAVDKNGNIPLHAAAYNNLFDVVIFLIQCGAKTWLMNADGDAVADVVRRSSGYRGGPSDYEKRDALRALPSQVKISVSLWSLRYSSCIFYVLSWFKIRRKCFAGFVFGFGLLSSEL